MEVDRSLPLSFARGVLLLLVALNLQALGEQIARSAQAWTLRGLFRPALYGLEAALWVVLFMLSFSSQGKRLLGLARSAAGSLAERKRWNWVALLALAALYPLYRLLPDAALIQRFVPHLWLWGHIVLLGALFLWAAWPGQPARRLLVCIVAGALLWQAVTLVSANRDAALAAQNQPKPPFVVAYLGGSITEGDGASDPERTSWRALTSAWLQDRYPENEVVSINSSVPGTGSDVGVLRYQEEVLQHEPDLVFIEFAVNDSSLTETVSMQAMEGIVRMILANRPTTRIFFVYTTTRELSAAYERGETPLAEQWHDRVAQHYAIPAIHAGLALWQEIAAGRTTWKDLTVDGVHPTDQGYMIYFESVRAALQTTRLDVPRPVLTLPPPLLPGSG